MGTAIYAGINKRWWLMVACIAIVAAAIVLPFVVLVVVWGLAASQ